MASQAVSLSHICLSLADQGFGHIFLDTAHLELLARDVVFVLSDLLPLLAIYWCRRGQLRDTRSTAGIVLDAGAPITVYQVVKFIYGYS